MRAHERVCAPICQGASISRILDAFFYRKGDSLRHYSVQIASNMQKSDRARRQKSQKKIPEL